MKQTATVYLNPDSEWIITRVVLSGNGHDSEPLPMEPHKSDLQGLLFGQPPQLFFEIGVNRDILQCCRCPVPVLLYVNEGYQPFTVVDDNGNCRTVAPHSTRRIAVDTSLPSDWKPAPGGKAPETTSISADAFFGRDMFWECDLRSVTVRYEDDLCHWESTTKKPAFWMRGKPVTPQQALAMIRRTDSVFGALPVWGMWRRTPLQVPDYLSLYSLKSSWFDEFHFGWCRPDGRIGMDSVMEGTPDARELILDGIRLLQTFPFLNLILLIWDAHGEWEFQPRQLATEGMPAIACGMHLHDGTVELLGGASAWAVFCQYQRDYGEEPVRYWDGYNAKTGTRVVDRAYLDACLAAGGVKYGWQVEWDSDRIADVSDQSLRAVSLRYNQLRKDCGEDEADIKW